MMVFHGVLLALRSTSFVEKLLEAKADVNAEALLLARLLLG